MARKRKPHAEQQPHERKPTPTFLLELPLQVTSSQAKRLRAHLEAARQVYNAVLSGAIRFCAPSNEWKSCLKRPQVSSDVRGKQHASGSGTARGVKPADNA